MLSLANSLSSISSALLDIVKSGLQAWYKADNTQAPLGEEEIANGEFSIGPEIITNSDFSTSGSIDDNSHTLGFQNSGNTGGGTISNGELILVGDTGTEEDYGRAFITNGIDSRSVVVADKTYKLTYTVSSASGAIQFGYHNGGWNEGSLSHAVGTHTYYITQASGTSFIIKNNGDGGTLKLSSISLKQTNPNDSWSKTGDTVVKDGTALIDGGLLYQAGVMVNGKKYRLELDVDSLSLGTGYIRLQDNSATDYYRITSDGHHTIDFTYAVAHSDFQLSATGSASAILSNITLKEVVNSVKDFSPNTNNGVLYSGKALHFAQAHDYVDIDYWKSEAISASTKATFAVWFNCDDVSPGAMIFAAAGTSRFYLGAKGAKLELGWGSSGWQTDSNSIAIVNHTWYRAVVVVDGLTCRVYLNGELAFSKTNGSSFTLDDNGVYIGSEGDIASNIWYGELSDFQIYDKAWTASDVTYDYNNPDKDVFDNSNSSITTTDCKALYRLNEGAGDRVYNAAPVLQANIINNHDFSGATSVQGNDTIPNDGAGSYTDQRDSGKWVKDSSADSSVEIDVGTFKGKNNVVKVKIPTHSNSNRLLQRNTIKPNTFYFVETEVFIESGNFRLDTTDDDIPLSFITSSTTGSWHTLTKVVKSESTAGTVDIFLRTSSAGGDPHEFYVNSVSFKEISLSESYVQNSWVSGNWITAQPYIPQYAMSSYSKKAIFGGAGSGDLIDCGKEDSIDDIFAGGGTWSAWISGVSASGDKGTILTKGQPRLRVRDDDGDDITLEFLHIFSGNNGVWRPPTTALLENKLNHVAVTYDNTDTANDPKIYINGVEQSLDYESTPTGSAVTDAGSDFRIGSLNSTTDPFDGFIDEVAVFDKILTEAEVQEIFNAGIALDCRDHSAYLGDEEFDDPGFDDPSEWNANTGWTVSGGKASVNHHETTALSQTLSVTQGKIYDLTFEISDYVEGAFQFGFNQFNIAGTSSNLPNFNKNGVYNYRVVALGDNINVYMYGVNASEFSIDNLSLREVQLNGYWRNNGVDTWTDLSPYGNNGTVNGSPTTIQLQEVPYFKKDTFGLPMNKVREKGLNLDGGSYVTIDDSSDFDFGTTGFTIQAWVKPFSLTANDRIITKGKTSDDEWMISVGADNASVRVYAQDSSTAVLDSENTFSTLSLNNWAMITVVIDTPNDQILFYKDDGNVESKTGASWSGNFNGDDSLIIAANKDLDADRFDGIIDDVKIYNRVLSSSEIERNYKVTKSKHASTSNWSDDFDDGFI